MRSILITLLCTLSLPALAQRSTDSSAIKLLLIAVGEKISRQQNLSYQSTLREITPGRNDSIETVSGQIWLSKAPADTFFGSIFHLKGADKDGDFDYYYDGQTSQEIRHQQKQIFVFDPSAFPNNPNNPAKARSALLPFLSLLTDSNIVHTLLDGAIAEELSDLPDAWIVKLSYPPDEIGMAYTRSVSISKKDSSIVADEIDTSWKGKNSRQIRFITMLSVNEPDIQPHLRLTSSFWNYTVTPYKRPTRGVDRQIALRGKPAPTFDFQSFDGRETKLEDFRGHYVLLDFWESWCGQCILAIPDLLKLHNRYSPKGLRMLGIVTENYPEVKQVIDANKIPYPVLKGDASVLRNYLVNGRPNYFFIDPKGRIVRTFVGTPREMTAMIDSTLK